MPKATVEVVWFAEGYEYPTAEKVDRREEMSPQSKGKEREETPCQCKSVEEIRLADRLADYEVTVVIYGNNLAGRVEEYEISLAEYVAISKAALEDTLGLREYLTSAREYLIYTTDRLEENELRLEEYMRSDRTNTCEVVRTFRRRSI